MWKQLAVVSLVAISLGACRDAFETSPQGARMASMPNGETVIELKFAEGLKLRADAQGRIQSEIGVDVSALQALLDALGVTGLIPLITVPRDKLEIMYADARRLSPDEETPDLLSWHRFSLPALANVDAVIGQLSLRPEIEYVYLAR